MEGRPKETPRTGMVVQMALIIRTVSRATHLQRWGRETDGQRDRAIGRKQALFSFPKS